MMKTTISQITPREENEVVVDLKTYFTGKIGDISLNGPIAFKQEEYEEFIDFDKMKAAVRQKVVDRILNGESPTE